MLRRRGFLAAAIAGCAPSAEPVARAPRRGVTEVNAALPVAAARAAPPPAARRRRVAPDIPRVQLCAAATPIEAAPDLARRLGLEALHIKRDDLTHASYGGSKVRKLETLLARAESEGAVRLVTFGSVGSHHALATAVHGRERGFEVDLLLVPEPPSAFVRETLRRTLATGARARLAGTMKAARARAAELAREGRTLVIPAGGTDPLANVGFVDAGFELAEQIARGELEVPERVYIALGTNGSAAGLALGLAAAGHADIAVVGVRASSPATSSEAEVARAIASTKEIVREHDASFPDLDVRVVIDGRELGRGYALTTPRAERALALAADGGLELETTYTAKAFAALARDAEARVVRRALFWMTHDARRGADVEPREVPGDLAGWLR